MPYSSIRFPCIKKQDKKRKEKNEIRIIKEKLVSIEEWKKYAWKIKKNGDAEVLKYDNYEIACAYNDCIIRPLSK